jgi:large subunit ribosomal protein L17
MASSLILHKRITTTTAKAKALRSYIEPLITKSKNDTTHSRRVVFSHLQNKIAVAELFREVSPKVMERPGGYTRILKTGNRLGDNAEMCIIELVDYNENMLGDTTKKSKTTRRRRGSGKAKAETAPVSAADTAAKEEDIAPGTEASPAGDELKAESETAGEEKVAAGGEAEVSEPEAESTEEETPAAKAESTEEETPEAEVESTVEEKQEAEEEIKEEPKAATDDDEDKKDDSSEDGQEDVDSKEDKKE